MSTPIRYSFQRCEKKYFVTPAQQQALLGALAAHMQPDAYGSYTICNIYYDTDDWRLIRASIEKPIYKEKLRVRSYGVPADGAPVFVELKKKLDGIVYKRRVTLPAELAAPFLSGSAPQAAQGQIADEILWFQRVYRAVPKVFLAYDRTAFAGLDDPELRLTFDRNIRWRTDALDLRLGDGGTPLLGSGRILMELKLPGICPMWLGRLLSELSVYPAAFSKYGCCYQDCILPQSAENHTIFKEARYSA